MSGSEGPSFESFIVETGSDPWEAVRRVAEVLRKKCPGAVVYVIEPDDCTNGRVVLEDIDGNPVVLHPWSLVALQWIEDHQYVVGYVDPEKRSP